jgi:hypothetical protein
MPNEEEDPRLAAGAYDLVQEDDDGDETTKRQPVYLYAPNKQDYASSVGGWGVFWQEGTMLLARDKRLTLTDWRVMAVLQARLDFENWIRLSHAEIGEQIDVARPNVSNSMKRLLGMQVVLPGPSVKQVRTYRLNPLFAWKGDLRQGATERRKQLKLLTGGKATGETPSP